MGPYVILALKIAVITVTMLFLASLLALWRGHQRLHGRINIAFLSLTLTALLGLEIVVRFVDPHVFAYFDEETHRNLRIHLGFSLPAAILLPVMLMTGLRHRRYWHITLGILFSVLWTGTFITGVFFLK